MRVIWAGGRTNPPLDKPKCGWENELCIEQDRQGRDMYSFNNVSLLILLLRDYLVYTSTEVEPQPRQLCNASIYFKLVSSSVVESLVDSGLKLPRSLFSVVGVKLFTLAFLCLFPK